MADDAYTVTNWDVVASDRIRLMGVTYKPKEHLKGTITLVHGIFGNSIFDECKIGRYTHVFDFFARAGYIITGYDQRGHGKSGGQRAHSPSMEQSLQVSRANPDLQHYLYGHSFGGGISLLFIERIKPPVPLTGVIVTDPLIKLYFTPPRAKVFFGRVVSKMAPEFSLSRDEAVGKAYMEDPLVARTVTTCMGSIILDMGDWIIKEADQIKLIHILFIHGTGDQVTSYLATQQVHDLATSTDKTMKLFEGWYHEPHNETEKEQLFAYILEWLTNHIHTENKSTNLRSNL